VASRRSFISIVMAFFLALGLNCRFAQGASIDGLICMRFACRGEVRPGLPGGRGFFLFSLFFSSAFLFFFFFFFFFLTSFYLVLPAS